MNPLAFLAVLQFNLLMVPAAAPSSSVIPSLKDKGITIDLPQANLKVTGGRIIYETLKFGLKRRLLGSVGVSVFSENKIDDRGRVLKTETARVYDVNGDLCGFWKQKHILWDIMEYSTKREFRENSSRKTVTTIDGRLEKKPYLELKERLAGTPTGEKVWVIEESYFTDVNDQTCARLTWKTSRFSLNPHWTSRRKDHNTWVLKGGVFPFAEAAQKKSRNPDARSYTAEPIPVPGAK